MSRPVEKSSNIPTIMNSIDKGGRFSVENPIAGQGGYGTVSKALDTELEREVAIKTLSPIFRDIEPQDIDRFKREAKILASMSHPNIPAIYDVDFRPDDNEFRLIYSWVNGKTLNQHLMDSSILSVEETRIYFNNICSALSYAHSKGIIHRDIKPSNLIVSNNNETCYVVDFGISLTLKDIERMTLGGGPSHAVGTPGYMSPEQENNEEIDESSDVYSLAIVLYECLSGSRPLLGDYKSVSLSNEAVPLSVDILIKECLQEKNKRIKSVDEFHNRLNQALRSNINMGLVFAKAPLLDVVAALKGLNHISFSHINAGHKVLLMLKFKSLVRKDDHKMRNPIASFIEALLRVCGKMDENDFRKIIANAFIYGFAMQYSEKWFGNPLIRSEMIVLAADLDVVRHKIFSDETLKFLSNKKKEEKEKIFPADVRTLLQNLLINDFCKEETALKIGDVLEKY